VLKAIPRIPSVAIGNQQRYVPLHVGLKASPRDVQVLIDRAAGKLEHNVWQPPISSAPMLQGWQDHIFQPEPTPATLGQHFSHLGSSLAIGLDSTPGQQPNHRKQP
jgi:hypothetical protein